MNNLWPRIKYVIKKNPSTFSNGGGAFSPPPPADDQSRDELKEEEKAEEFLTAKYLNTFLVIFLVADGVERKRVDSVDGMPVELFYDGNPFRMNAERLNRNGRGWSKRSDDETY